MFFTVNVCFPERVMRIFSGWFVCVSSKTTTAWTSDDWVSINFSWVETSSISGVEIVASPLVLIVDDWCLVCVVGISSLLFKSVLQLLSHFVYRIHQKVLWLSVLKEVKSSLWSRFKNSRPYRLRMGLTENVAFWPKITCGTCAFKGMTGLCCFSCFAQSILVFKSI